MHITALFFAVLVFSQLGFAKCRIVSLEKNPNRYITNMIKGTPDIYYAQAISYSAEDEAFTFKVLEAIRGEKRKEITVPGSLLDPNAVESDFGYHKAEAFWKDITAARTTFGSDCRLNPKFKVGSRYLIFYKTPYQAKSFEYVKNRGDRWFVHVWETLYPPKRVKTQTAATTAPAAAAPTAPPAEAATASEAPTN